MPFVVLTTLARTSSLGAHFLVSGLFAMSTIQNELFTIFGAAAGLRAVTLTGFVMLSLLLLLLMQASVTCLCIYTQLQSEDYRWQWRSFLMGSCV